MKNQRILFLNEYLTSKQPIVLFDGECTLCSNSVHFLLRHNHSGNLSFASLQSGIGSEIVKLTGDSISQADTLMFLQDNKLFTYSTAALMITTHLSFPWYLLKGLIIVPSIIRDTIYRLIAKNRYEWFGRKSFCLKDDYRYRNRFLY